MHKRLYRSTKDRMIAGVCGGLGEFFEMDPVIWRILFLAGLFAGGAAAVIYLIMAVIVPEEGGATNEAVDAAAAKVKEVVQHTDRNWLIGLVLLALGVVFLLENILPAFSLHLVWPIILIAAGLGVLLNGFDSK